MSTATAASSAVPSMDVDTQIKQNKALTTSQHQAMARVIYEGYGAFSRGDFQTAMKDWSPDAVIDSNVGSKNLPWQGRWPGTGPQEFMKYSALVSQHLPFAMNILQVVPGADGRSMMVVLRWSFKTATGDAELRDSLAVHSYKFNSDNKVIGYQETSDTGSQVALLDGRYKGNAGEPADAEYVGDSSFQGNRDEQLKTAKQWYQLLLQGDVPGVLGLFAEDSYTMSNYPGYPLCPYNNKFGPGGEGHLQFVQALTGACELAGSASFVVPADQNVVIASWDGIIRGKTSKKQIDNAHAFHIFTFNQQGKIASWVEVTDSATEKDVLDGKFGRQVAPKEPQEETKEGTN